jgi:hypothetical protein
MRLACFDDPLGHERVGRLDTDRIVELQARSMGEWMGGEG